jgi:hypothetical protein
MPTVSGFSVADPYSIQRGIELAYRAGLRQVVIPPGLYPVAADPQTGAHLHFAKMKDFSIDAAGVTLVFTTRGKNSIDFNQCTGVTLRGATLLRAMLPFSQGRIMAISADRKTAGVQVSSGYPADFDDVRYFDKIGLNLYDSATRMWKDDCWSKEKFERTGPSMFRFHAGRALDPAAGWVVGAAVAWRGAGGSDVSLTNCSGMKILDITIKGGAGFCVHENGGDGHNYYRYTVTYSARPAGATEDPLMSSNADAFHSDGVRHGPTLEDCHFEGMNDDGIPIHGAYALVEASSGNQITLKVRNSPFCATGDRLRFLDDQGALAGEAKVVSFQTLSAYQPSQPPPRDLRLFQTPGPRDSYEEVTLDQPVSAKFGWLIANADANGDGFVIRRCTVRNNRARGMLIKASDGLIENCTVEGSSMGGIVIAPEMEYWNEADYARNLVVRNNVVRHCIYVNQPQSSQAGAITVDAYDNHHFVQLPGGHRNILIEGNTVENVDGPNLVISSVQGVMVQNNRFIHSMWHASERGRALGVDSSALIWLTESSDVHLTGNLLVNPGPFLKSNIVATPTVTGSGLQDGLSPSPAP